MLVSAIHGTESRLVDPGNVRVIKNATLSELRIALAIANRSPVIYICQSVMRVAGQWQVKLIRVG